MTPLTTYAAQYLLLATPRKGEIFLDYEPKGVFLLGLFGGNSVSEQPAAWDMKSLIYEHVAHWCDVIQSPLHFFYLSLCPSTAFLARPAGALTSSDCC